MCSSTHNMVVLQSATFEHLICVGNISLVPIVPPCSTAGNQKSPHFACIMDKDLINIMYQQI